MESVPSRGSVGSVMRKSRFQLILGVLVAISAISVVWATWYRAKTAPDPFVASEGAVAPLQKQTTLEITYIANEGVLISSGESHVLIDGLHREYKRSYAFLPAAQREKIETAKTPFEEIDLILLHCDVGKAALLKIVNLHILRIGRLTNDVARSTRITRVNPNPNHTNYSNLELFRVLRVFSRIVPPRCGKNVAYVDAPTNTRI